MTASDAQARSQRAQAPGFYRFAIGDFGAVALHDGVLQRDRPAGFVRNAADGEVAEAFAAIGLPADKLTLTFTPLLVDTGNRVVLIDTGLGATGPAGTGRLVEHLAAGGYRPEDVGTVLISHFHGDHIGGLRRKDDAPLFPRAEIAVPQPEWDYWMDDARAAAAPEATKRNFELSRRMLSAGDVRRFSWGEEVLPGFTAVQADGHTPGQTAFEIRSGKGSLLYVADITNNPLIFARHPEWQAAFDMDGDTAVRTRRRLLDRAATERLQLFFFHAPFPATGFVVRSGAGYEYFPALWKDGR